MIGRAGTGTSRWRIVRRALRMVAFSVHAARLATLAVNVVTMPRLRRAQVRPARPTVSILIPARDEEHNLRRFLPGVLAQGADEVLVLDDGSSDATAAVARELGATVLTGSALPAGWKGKPHACVQLADAAAGDLLAFADADVEWAPGALDAVLRQLHGADVVTVIPPATDLTWGARLLAPLVAELVLTLLPYPVLQSRWRRATCASGALLLFTRDAYAACGGHSGVRTEILDDQRLGEQAKAAGLRVRQVLGQRLVRVRMYDGYRASLSGFSKNAFEVHQRSRMVLLGSWAVFAVTFSLPWLLPASTRADRVLRALAVADRTVVNVVQGRRSPADVAEGLLGPVTALAALPGYLLALRPRQTWKGRVYTRE